jgi:protocatechuate 3,4-dioxygenase beta subunit
MFLTKAKIATLFLLAASIAAAGVFTFTQHEAAAQPAAHARPFAKDAVPQAPGQAAQGERHHEGTEAVVLTGRVLDAQGKSVPGVKLYLSTSDVKKKEDLTPRATTDADGRFRFTATPAELERDAKIVATAKGYAPDWTGVSVKGAEFSLRLAPDEVPVLGRIIDLEGRPVAGASVQVRYFEQGDLNSWIDARKKKRFPSLEQKIGPLVLEGPGQVKTDKDGRFRLAGFGSDRVVHLEVKGDLIETSYFEVVVRKDGTGLPEGMHAATFEHLVGPSKPIIGTVRDKRTANPVAGITVVCPSTQVWGKAITDKSGTFQITGMPKRKDYYIAAGGPPYFNTTLLNVPDTPGMEPLTLDIDVEKGVAVRGRLLDKVTGKPVRGYVGYIPAPDNPNLKDYSLGGPQVIATDSGRAGPDGSFTVVAVPGPGFLTTYADDRGGYLGADVQHLRGFPPNSIPEQYNAITPINVVEADPRTTTCDILLQPARVLTGTVVGPDGKPLAGALAAGLADVPLLSFGGTDQELAKASFTVGGLDPSRPRSLFFIHKEKKLAKLFKVQGDEKGPLTVRLEPLGSVTGRVLDAAGKPRAGLTVAVQHSAEQKDYKGLPLELLYDYPAWTKLIDASATTDVEGRFHVTGLVPGLKYFINIKDGESLLNTYTWWDGLTIESSKEKDLGDLKDKPEK